MGRHRIAILPSNQVGRHYVGKEDRLTYKVDQGITIARPPVRR